jgi:hypothetical protein
MSVQVLGEAISKMGLGLPEFLVCWGKEKRGKGLEQLEELSACYPGLPVVKEPWKEGGRGRKAVWLESARVQVACQRSLESCKSGSASVIGWE